MLKRSSLPFFVGAILLSAVLLMGQAWAQCIPDPGCIDNDGDGYGNPASAQCTHQQLDCDDDVSDDPSSCATCTCGQEECSPCAKCIHPGITEAASGDPVCSDTIDNDCDGLTDIEDDFCNAVITQGQEPCADVNPLKNLYFGALHIHTALSFDAWPWETNAGPEDAYRFAKGEPLSIMPLDENGQGTRTVQLEHPLDFAAVTDHAEFFAEVAACLDPGSAAYGSETCVSYRERTDDSLILMSSPLFDGVRMEDICGPDGVDCPLLAESVWKRVQQAAEDADDHTSQCSFTAFAGYEYTELKNNLHRNVIFRNENVPELPVSWLDQPTTEGLWTEYQPDEQE